MTILHNFFVAKLLQVLSLLLHKKINRKNTTAFLRMRNAKSSPQMSLEEVSYLKVQTTRAALIRTRLLQYD